MANACDLCNAQFTYSFASSCRLFDKAIIAYDCCLIGRVNVCICIFAFPFFHLWKKGRPLGKHVVIALYIVVYDVAMYSIASALFMGN